MGEPVFLTCWLPDRRLYRLVEANCGDPQLEADRLELGARVSFWLNDEDQWDETVWSWWRGMGMLEPD